ncbi:hypothetical protein [Kribbella sp. DT2]|uniref:hypothetical protein n=1 Tax=Kribbella sp. DT2 TaxID=3393427 RepID=UPI003CF78F34
MSQQYGPPQNQNQHQPPAGQPGGWGPGPGYPAQYRPGGRKNRRTQWIVIGGVVLAVVLIATGAVLLVTAGKKDNTAAPTTGQSLTPAPVGTLYTPEATAPTTPQITKGPYDKGVEIGGGVWFTPAKGWVKDPDKTRSGHNYLLPEPGRPGAIDGYFWIRQTTLMGAQQFAEHLVDVESNNLEHVVIGKGGFRTCPNKALKLCYATNYSAVVPVKGKKSVVFSGFVQTFEDFNGQTTATDAALQREVWPKRRQEILNMNGTLVRSF